jgi:hypothetical protein
LLDRPLSTGAAVVAWGRASFDGKHPMRIERGGSVHFQTSLCPLPLINIGSLDRDWYEVRASCCCRYRVPQAMASHRPACCAQLALRVAASGTCPLGFVFLF